MVWRDFWFPKSLGRDVEIFGRLNSEGIAELFPRKVILAKKVDVSPGDYRTSGHRAEHCGPPIQVALPGNFLGQVGLRCQTNYVYDAVWSL